MLTHCFFYFSFENTLCFRKVFAIYRMLSSKMHDNFWQS